MPFIKVGISARKRSETSFDDSEKAGGSNGTGGHSGDDEGAEADAEQNKEQEHGLPFPVTTRRPSSRRTKSKHSARSIPGSAQALNRKRSTATEARSRKDSRKRPAEAEEQIQANEKEDEDNILNPNSTTPAPIKTARITTASPRQRLKVHWARFKQRLGTGSALSESLLDGAGGTIGGESTDTSASCRRRRGRGKPSVGDTDGEGEDLVEGPDDADSPVVNRVVVENELGERWSATQPSTSGATNSGPGSKSGGGGRRPPTGGAKKSSQSRSRSHPSSQSKVATNDGEAEGNDSDGSLSGTGATGQTYGIWESYVVLTFLRWRLWPAVSAFFTMRFMEESTEIQYRREVWVTSKSLAFYSALFFVCNWILAIALGTRPFRTVDIVYLYGFQPLLSIPLPFLVLYDIPRTRPWLYQSYIMLPVWSWSIYQTCTLYTCGFYGQFPFTCGNRDFIGLFYYAVAIPTIAMFGLRQARFGNFVGVVSFLVINAVLVVPFKRTWIRNLLNMILFHAFLTYIHYKRETTERRLYSLRDQLKVQFRATQKAQVNERKAMDSKLRLTSYVFHEVRVPLNTALLAVQNMEATYDFAKELDVEWAALGGSLSMMSKVLNDVLDFDRLDSGRFSTVKAPYNLHQAIRSMLVPLQLAVNARGLKLHVELDPRIDYVARRAYYAALGHDEAWIEKQLMDTPDDGGLVVGDEMRLRQIVTNLASNACKFTATGGNIRIVTKLIYPVVQLPDHSQEPAVQILSIASDSSSEAAHADKAVVSNDGVDSSSAPAALSMTHLSKHDSIEAMKKLNRIAVRMEVHDSGVGIRARDLVDNKLFSPYVQTEIGKYQGGKGTGLGLALVRRIVKLSGGRLGVKSKIGEGSQFWVELPFGVGEKAITEPSRKADFHPDGSEYSDGRRERALGLEEIKFFRAVGEGNAIRPGHMPSVGVPQVVEPTPSGGAPDDPLKTVEGDTPSTLVREAYGIPPVALNTQPFANAEVDALAGLGAGDKRDRSTLAQQAQSQTQSLQPPPATSSERAMRSIMDQQGLFELSSQSTPAQWVEERAGFSGFGGRVGGVGDGTTGAGPSSGSKTPSPADLPPNNGVLVPPPLSQASVSAPTPLTTLPVSLQKQTSTTPPARPVLASSGASLRVLVVDDDLLTRKLMSRMLTRIGCVVDTAENGKIALDKILGLGVVHPVAAGAEGVASSSVAPAPTEQGYFPGYDIVFLDNQMPVMSGLDTVSRLRAKGRKDLVVGVTGNALLSDQREYLDVGADRVLTKPVFEGSLRAMLHLAEERRKGFRQQSETSTPEQPIASSSAGNATRDQNPP